MSLRLAPFFVLFLLVFSACSSSITTALPPSPTPTSSPTPLDSTSPEASPTSEDSPTPEASPSPEDSPTPVSLSCTSSGSASADWVVVPYATSPALTSLTVSSDTITFTFLSGTPAFTLTPQASSVFLTDPQGAKLTGPGSSGVLIHLSDFRGDTSNYSGAKTLTSTGPLLLQVNRLGDFEGVLSFGASTSAPACAHVTATPSSLTFQFVNS